MREHPILFSTEMVQAILAGTKTQTRRVIKPQPEKVWDEPYGSGTLRRMKWKQCNYRPASSASPYGAVGDYLWVREAWANSGVGIIYQASYSRPDLVKWKPSIHMFRDDARLLLKIQDIRIERLNDISDKDVFAEGCPRGVDAEPRDIYMTLWEKINGAGSWSENPWVWVLQFEVMT